MNDKTIPLMGGELPANIWLPGFAGQLESYLYNSSYIAIPEVARAATLGLLAGVCGRAFCTPTGKDLALYIILVARSGIGKDGMHEGIPRLLQLAKVPYAENFIRQTDFASGPALHKALLSTPGFLNLQGEFGRKLKGMADNSNAPMQAFRTVMTNAYGKPFLEGKDYSKGEDSLPGVWHPAFSFLGETTPSTFNEALTADMAEDGFLSRFLTVTHLGDRPPANELRMFHLEPDELAHWQALLNHAVKYQLPVNMPEQATVQYKDDGVEYRFSKFAEECRQAINAAGDNEYVRAVWNRAHLKALIIASLLAVADDHTNPQINPGHAVAGMDLVKADAYMFLHKQREGDVGNDDHSRLSKIRLLISEYYAHPLPKSYRIPESLKENCIVPHMYLQIRTQRMPAFCKHAHGATAALNHTVKSLLDSGYFMEVDKGRISAEHGFRGRCYMPLNTPPE